MDHIPSPSKASMAQTVEKFITDHPFDFNAKSKAQREIDGELGPAPMTGVVHYPFNGFTKVYHSDFRAKVAYELTHPYLCTARPGAGSIPFSMHKVHRTSALCLLSLLRVSSYVCCLSLQDILSASNYDDDKVNGQKNWISETEREYYEKDLMWAKSAETTGVRSECTLGN